MQDQPRNPRSLSDISHLFLSSVRDRQTGSAPRPQRTPPPKNEQRDAEALSHDLGQALGEEHQSNSSPVPPVRAVLASHLGSRQFDAVRTYAKSLASSGRRVGLIWIDVSEFALMTYEPDERLQERNHESDGAWQDPRVMREAIAELNCDVDCWILAVANPRVPEGRALLRDAARWVLLSSKDHDAVVAAYRTLKGLADLSRPRLSIAALDVADPAESELVFSKMASTCMQFLNWSLEAEQPVADAPNVAECVVMQCTAQGDKAHLASAGHWQVVAELLEQARESSQQEAEHTTPEAVVNPVEMLSEQPAPQQVKKMSAAELSAAQARLRRLSPPPQVEVAPVSPTAENSGPSDVIDLPPDGSVLDAVMKHSMSQIIECPIRPPMCPEARLGVSRDRRLVLVAATGHGLGELRSIGLAYRWLMENRALVAMALPQLSVDAKQLPHLRLLVDQADLNADVLQPIFQVNTVTISSYRRLRWGERNGLLLEAA